MASSEPLTLKTSTEFPLYAVGECHMHALASVVSGAAGGAERAPVAISLVIDVSGSMTGEKMSLTKAAARFVVQHMGATDRLGIVLFGSDVEEALTLTKMDGPGKLRANKVVDSIVARCLTNLSGGLFQGLQQQLDLASSAPSAPVSAPARQTGTKRLRSGRKVTTNQQSSDAETTSPASIVVQSVLLLTDGLPNTGVTDPKQIVQAAKAMLNTAAGGSGGTAKKPSSTPQAALNISVHCFGFGADHSEQLLEGLTKVSSGGMYHFVENAENIPEAFADALGGLLSTVAQNVRLRITPRDGARLVKVQAGKHAISHDMANAPAVVNLGELTAEESRDMILELQLRSAAAGEAYYEACDLELNYIDVHSANLRVARHTLVCARGPKAALKQKEGNVDLDMHRNRLATAEDMEKAREHADAGRLEEARKLLRAAIERVRKSASADHPVCKELAEDCQDALETMGTRAAYNTTSRKFLTANMHSHYIQKSVGKQGRSSKRAVAATAAAPPTVPAAPNAPHAPGYAASAAAPVLSPTSCYAGRGKQACVQLMRNHCTPKPADP